MITRRLHLPEAWRGGDELLVQGPPYHYLARVLRVEAGQQLALFDGRGRQRTAAVLEVGREGLRLALGPSVELAADARPAAPLILLAGLTRGAALDRVVREVTELGVAEIRPVITQRSVAVPSGAGLAARQQRWQRIAAEAARQCGRAAVPPVAEILPLAQALSRLEQDLVHGDGEGPVRLVGWPGSAETLPLAPGGGGAGVALLVGPEGGLSAEELTAAVSWGFSPFGMGRRVLRAETAALVAVALVQHRLGELG